MIEVDYFLLSEGAVPDATGKLSLINIFEVLTTDAPSVKCPKFTLSFCVTPELKKQKNKMTFDITILDPKGEVVLSVEGSGQMAKKSGLATLPPKFASSVDLSGVTFTAIGTHQANLTINDELVATRPFHIVLG